MLSTEEKEKKITTTDSTQHLGVLEYNLPLKVVSDFNVFHSRMKKPSFAKFQRNFTGFRTQCNLGHQDLAQ
jgi:hypothetical protein